MTWQIDLDLVEEWIIENTTLKEYQGKFGSFTKTNKRIGAIIPVHVLGGLVDMEKLLNISRKYHITIVEDSTEAPWVKFLEENQQAVLVKSNIQF